MRRGNGITAFEAPEAAPVNPVGGGGGGGDHSGMAALMAALAELQRTAERGADRRYESKEYDRRFAKEQQALVEQENRGEARQMRAEDRNRADWESRQNFLMEANTNASKMQREVAALSQRDPKFAEATQGKSFAEQQNALGDYLVKQESRLALETAKAKNANLSQVQALSAAQAHYQAMTAGNAMSEGVTKGRLRTSEMLRGLKQGYDDAEKKYQTLLSSRSAQFAAHMATGGTAESFIQELSNDAAFAKQFETTEPPTATTMADPAFAYNGVDTSGDYGSRPNAYEGITYDEQGNPVAEALPTTGRPSYNPSQPLSEDMARGLAKRVSASMMKGLPGDYNNIVEGMLTLAGKGGTPEEFKKYLNDNHLADGGSDVLFLLQGPLAAYQQRLGEALARPTAQVTTGPDGKPQSEFLPTATPANRNALLATQSMVGNALRMTRSFPVKSVVDYQASKLLWDRALPVILEHADNPKALQRAFNERMTVGSALGMMANLEVADPNYRTSPEWQQWFSTLKQASPQTAAQLEAYSKDLSAKMFIDQQQDIPAYEGISERASADDPGVTGIQNTLNQVQRSSKVVSELASGGELSTDAMQAMMGPDADELTKLAEQTRANSASVVGMEPSGPVYNEYMKMLQEHNLDSDIQKVQDTLQRSQPKGGSTPPASSQPSAPGISRVNQSTIDQLIDKKLMPEFTSLGMYSPPNPFADEEFRPTTLSQGVYYNKKLRPQLESTFKVSPPNPTGTLPDQPMLAQGGQPQPGSPQGAPQQPVQPQPQQVAQGQPRPQGSIPQIPTIQPYQSRLT